jgi:hypothetical protein
MKFCKLIMSVRSPNAPNLVEIRPIGVARHIREICAFVSYFVNFLIPSSRAQAERLNGLNRCWWFMPQSTRLDKEVPFGCIEKTIFFKETIPSPEFSRGVLHANHTSRMTFERWEIDEKFQQPTHTRSVSKKRDVISGLARPLANEIVFPPFSARRKALITRVGNKVSMIYIMDIYHDFIMIFCGANIIIYIDENIRTILLWFAYLRNFSCHYGMTCELIFYGDSSG